MSGSVASLMPWLSQHGPLLLLVLLSLGIVGLPIPDETLLIISGILIKRNIFSPVSTLFFVFLGACVGITVSFLLGKFLNKAVLMRFMRYFKMNVNHLTRVEYWYARYGKWTLIFGYFIPGVRHLIGVFSGLMQFSYKKFCLFAYVGGALWSLTFLSAGYFAGDEAIHYFNNLIASYGYGIILLLITLLGGFLLYTYKKIFH